MTYSIEVFDSEALLVASADDVADSGEADSTWSVDVDLTEDGHYSWTVTAVDDEGETSETPEAAPFFVSLADDAPIGVAFVEPGPVEGSTVETESPIFYVTEGFDPEGASLTYSIQIDTANTFDTEGLLSEELAATGSGTVLWDLAAAGLSLPNGTVYARVRATDEAGINSEYDTITFTVSAGPSLGCNCGDSGGASLVAAATSVEWWTLLLILLPMLRRRRRE